MMTDEHIKVWRFRDAPTEYQELSRNGGDEDWVALVPFELRDAYIPWLESTGFDAGQSPEEFILPDGGTVYIGSHA